MAITYPKSIYGSSTNEAIFFKLLQDKTSSKHHVWFEKGDSKEPGVFIMLAPNYQIFQFLLFEWQMKDFLRYDAERVYLRYHGEGLPVDVDIDVTPRREMEIVKMLQAQAGNDSYFDNVHRKLEVNTIYVLPNIMEADFMHMKVEGSTLNDVFPRPHAIVKEDIDRLVGKESFLDVLNSLFLKTTSGNSTYEDIELEYLRYALHPWIEVASLTESLQLMLDVEQEQIIHLDPTVNLLVQGGAGTGKSTLLTKRAKWIIDHHPNSRMLVVCYHNTTAEELRKKIPDPTSARGMIRILDAEGLKEEFHNKSYDYVLVDEGQDLTLDHYKKLMKLIKDDGHIWIVANGGQNIYGNVYDFKDIGVVFNEIITLDKNYRSNKGILTLCNGFMNHVIQSQEDFASSSSTFVAESTRVFGSGKRPEVHSISEIADQAGFVTNRLKQLHNSGHAYEGNCVVVFSDTAKDEVAKQLKQAQIPYRLKGDPQSAGGVALARAHELKGKEFKRAFILNTLTNEDDLSRKLLYLAIMRAKEELIVLIGNNSAYGSVLQDLLTQQKENGTAIEVDAPYYIQVLIRELEKAMQEHTAIEQKQRLIDEQIKALDAAKEEMTNREMRAIVAEGPKDIEVLKQKIETKDAKIQQLTKEVEALRKTIREAKVRNWSKLWESMHFERERILSIVKWIVIVAVLAGLYVKLPQWNQEFDLTGKLLGFYENMNAKLEPQEDPVEDNQLEAVQLEVIGDDETQSSYIQFGYDNPLDDGKLLNGNYQNGFKMILTKESGKYSLSMQGRFIGDDGLEVQMDKVMVLESASITIRTNNELTFKHTDEGVVPVKFLWPQDEEGNYFEVYQ